MQMQPTAILDQKIDALRPRFFEMLSDRRARFQQIRARLAALAGPQDPAAASAGADRSGADRAADTPVGASFRAASFVGAGFKEAGLPVANLAAASLSADKIAAASLPVLLDDLCFGAHRIVGVAATFGFSTLGTLARAVERMRRPSSPQDPRAADLLAALDDLLAEMTRVLR